MKSLYVFMDSSLSADEFPNNKNTDFTNRMPEQLLEEGTWLVGLIDICMPPVQGGAYLVSIMSDICATSNTGNTKIPILRKVAGVSQSACTTLSFPHVIYVPVLTRNINTIRVYIRGEGGNCPSFNNTPLACTLHFLKV